MPCAAGADDGFFLQRLQLLPLWCAPGPRWPITLAAILRCAHAVSVRLQSAYGESSETDERSSFLEDLRAHLHRGASAQVLHMPCCRRGVCSSAKCQDTWL